MMEKGLEILQHIEKLYSKDYDESYAMKLASKNPDMVEAWNDAFKDYDLVDVLCAIDEFWNFKSSKSRPSVAHIRAILSGKKDVVKPVMPSNTPKTIDPAVSFMQRDIELGRCHHLLPIYQRAVKYTCEELLYQEIPTDVWRRMSFPTRYEQAMKHGLFNDFEETLKSICFMLNGKEYQF